MKNRVKQILIFLGGLVVGALVISIVMGRLNQQQYANSYTLSVMEKALEATELRAHRQEELAKRIEATLPEGVLAIHQHKEFRNAPYGTSALRTVKNFYEVNSLPIPPEISDILKSVPSNH
jgi:hypothetical protein